jgi:hypothetical protein
MDIDLAIGFLQSFFDLKDGFDQFVEWEIGVVLKVEMMHFSRFIPLLQ